MEVPLIVVGTGALIFLAHLFSHMFRTFQIPDVLFLVLIGLVLGPVTGLVDVTEFGPAAEIFVTLTLLIILFEAGLSIELRSLLASAPRALILMIATLGSTVLVAAPIAHHLLGIPVTESILVGVLLGGVSTGIAVPLLAHLPVSERTRSLIALEANLNDVITVGIVFAIIDFAENGFFSTAAFSTALGFNLILSLIIGAASAVLWSQLIAKVRGIQNNMFMTPALVFMIFGVTELLGASGIFAVFAFGITLGNLELLGSHWFMDTMGMKEFRLTKWERRTFAGLVFLLKTYFFVYIGLAIGLDHSLVLAIGLLTTLILFLFRAGIVRVAIGNSIPQFDRIMLYRILPKGLMGAAFITLVHNEVARDFTYAVILSSIVVTSALVFLAPKKGEGEEQITDFSHHRFADADDAL